MTLVSRAHPTLISGSAFGRHEETDAISADGRFVAFVSESLDLVDGYVRGFDPYPSEVFLFDRATGSTTLVSRSAASPLRGGNGWSSRPSISAGGRFVAFVSQATDLVQGQIETGFDLEDVFVFDRVSGTTALVSHTSSSTVAAAGAYAYERRPLISADGSRVAFVSQAMNIVPGQVDVADSQDVFVYDVATHSVRLASHSDAWPPTAGLKHSELEDLSADGKRVVFSSLSTNLISGLIDLNSSSDVFLYDDATTLVTLVSRAAAAVNASANAGAGGARISADGAWVAFESQATDVVAGQLDAAAWTADVFLFQVATGARTLVSHTPGFPTTTASSDSTSASLSANGSVVAFTSAASNLTPATTIGTNGYAFDRASGTNALVSATAGGVAVGQWQAGGLSADGRYVAYATAGSPVGTDLNLVEDVFVRDRWSGNSTVVSVAAGTTATTGNGRSELPRISADGSTVVFRSWATNLAAGDGNEAPDVFVSGPTGATIVTRHASASFSATPAAAAWIVGAPPPHLRPKCVSGDGRFVVYHSFSEAIVPGTTTGYANHAETFIADRSTGVSRLVSHASSSPAAAVSGEASLVSADGRWVAFKSWHPQVVAGQVDIYGQPDAFVFDRTTGSVSLVSHAAGAPLSAAHGRSTPVDISADGRYILIVSAASDLVPNVTPVDGPLLFLCDRVANACALVSHAAASPTGAPNGMIPEDPARAAMSADGRYVAYEATSTDIVPGQVDPAETSDVFLYDRVSGTNVLVSHKAGANATVGDGYARLLALSADGAFVAFASNARNLVAGVSDTNGSADVFLYARATGLVSLVSHAAGLPGVAANGDSSFATVSADGRFVAFTSAATNVAAGQSDAAHWWDVFLYDRIADSSTLVSHSSASPLAAADADSYAGLVSADGSRVVFRSRASNVVPGQTAPAGGFPPENMFVYERQSGALALASPRRGTTTVGVGAGYDPACISADGSLIVYASPASDLVADDRNRSLDVFAYAATHFKGSLNGDRHTDLVLRKLNAPVNTIWLMDGNDTRLGQSDVTPDQTGPDWQLRGIDDFDGDKQSDLVFDLVFRNLATGAVEFWAMDGAVRRGGPVALVGPPPSLAWTLSATGDFDHDARPDIVWRNTLTREIRIWTMDRATPMGVLTPSPSQAEDANWEIVAALDLDRDGNTDFVWYNASSGRVVYWLMDAQVHRTVGQFFTPMQAGDANWKVLAAGDFGVGPGGLPDTADLVWRNATSGRYVVWHMDTRGVRTSGRFLNPPAPSDPLGWTIAGPR